ncbi:MAG: response regulator [Anaerolineales bacterium]|nr:response regulator [Anaerolineales bacterium]
MSSYPKATLPKNYRLRTLIADDDMEARRSTRLMLSLYSELEVVALAQNGLQAVELADEYQPDLAFMDVNMPEMDGLTAVRKIKETHPDMVFIMISAERDSKILKEAITGGAIDYLVKPFTDEDLDKAIQRAIVVWKANRQRLRQGEPIAEDQHVTLERLAHVYAQAKRTDNQAVAVFERLAADPNCELRWLLNLGMLYVIRQEWTKLKGLAAYMERQAGDKKSL